MRPAGTGSRYSRPGQRWGRGAELDSTEPDLTGRTGCARGGSELERGERALGPGTPG